MFLYPQKILVIEITGQAGNDLFSVKINGENAGALSSSLQGGGAYFIASNDISIQLTGVPTILPTGYPASILVDYADAVSTGIDEISYNQADPPQSSGYYLLPTTNYGNVLVHSGEGYTWQIEGGDGDVQVVGTSSDPSNPYGTYTEDSGFNYTVTISPDPAIAQTNPIYFFENSPLPEGLNEICFENIKNNGSGNSLNLKLNLYEISGSYLVNPYEIGIATLNPPTGSGECIVFELQYPIPENYITLYEFPPSFAIDTGNLNQIFTGSGVHSKKDVTFFFDIVDQKLNTIQSNQQFLENPLVGKCSFDLLNINGSVAVENFLTGVNSRSITVFEYDNVNAFGSYQKDFGVRCKVPNSFDGSTFTGDFFVYGNFPNILDIIPDFSEFSGNAQAKKFFNNQVVLQNDTQFVKIERYDVYASTGQYTGLTQYTYLNPKQEAEYLLSQVISDEVTVRNLRINQEGLSFDTPYYFTVVPYCPFGSGNSFNFGPVTFVSEQGQSILPVSNLSAVNIYDGNGFASTVYKTGVFYSDTGILHEFSSGQFTSVKYLIEIHSGDTRLLSEANGIVHNTGLYLTHQPVNDTSTTYQLTGLAGGLCGLYASGDGYINATYKLQATMI